VKIRKQLQRDTQNVESGKPETACVEYNLWEPNICSDKGKGLPQQAEVAQGVPGRLRPRIFLTFGTTRVVGRQPYTPAAFTSGEIPGSHF
jgi:hypothetical protein